MSDETLQESGKRDGRRKRSERSRHKIAEAMIDLIMAGDVTPSAEAVAARAGVGLRSVFRHFKDMDSLFHEVSQIMQAVIEPEVQRPLKEGPWREQLSELIETRARVFEKIMPMQQASMVQRYRSDFVKQEMARNIAMMRKAMSSVLPEEVLRDKELVEALDAVLSPVTWMRLRIDQNLSPEKSRKVMDRLAKSLLEGAK